MENVRKDTDVKFVKTEKTGDYLVSDPNCNTTKIFSGHLLTIEMKKKDTYE